MATDVAVEFGRLGVVPVVRLERAADALPLAEALLAGGLPCAEITFRTEAAEEAIRLVAAQVPHFLVGAGTVLTVDQADRAVAAGAQFVVSPGFDPEIVCWCLEREVWVLPGAATPTEIQMALARGLRHVKFFPAELLGGVRMLKALGEVYSQMRFIPTGGITPENLGDYLSVSAVYACGGTWLAKADLIQRGAFGEIERLAREAVQVVARTRGDGC